MPGSLLHHLHLPRIRVQPDADGCPAPVAGFAVEGFGELGIRGSLQPGLELFEKGVEVSHGA